MPDVELCADYDQDGRLSGSSTEYAARSTGHGAIIAINIDRDGRALPSTARVGSVVALDHTMPTKTGNDNDPLPLDIIVSPNAVTNFASLSLCVSGDNADAVMLIDGRSRIVVPTQTQSNRVDFPLPLQQGRQNFKLEAKRVPGSPLGRASGALTVSVMGRDATGNVSNIDRGQFLLARFLVMDDLSTAQQVYTCNLPDNVPSVSDVRDALAGLSPAVELRIVEIADSLGDGWIQDQFQLGYMVTPAGTMRTILHMPRFRKNAQVGPSQRNLAELVRTHFPSTNFGLIDDFWQRQITIRHLGGATSVAFQVSEEAFRILHKVERTEHFLRDAIERLCEAAHNLNIPYPSQCNNLPRRTSSLPLIRLQLRELHQRIEQLVTRLLSAVSSSQEVGLRVLRTRARALVQELDREFRVTGTAGNEVFELALSLQTFRMEAMDVVDLYDTVIRMHDSLVYGGNIEASPPVSGHPFGKVVIGEGDNRPMDPPVRDLFDSNAAIQPVVTLDTAWLAVGHVDELIAFLLNRMEQDRHIVLRASPEVAFKLFDKAIELYLSGLPWYHPDKGRGSNWHPLTIARHLMNEGSHPITRLFRGKLWLHAHPRPPSGQPEEEGGEPTQDTGEILNPPEIYLRAVDWYKGLLGEILAPYYPDSDQDNHYYKAAISAWEIEFFEGGTNQAIIDDKMSELDKLLQREFADFPILKAPVLFDRAPELSDGATVAFTPNLVNLQYVNGTVLIPNSFGPRMQTGDAVQVIQHVLQEENLGTLASKMSIRYLQRQRLNISEIWINRDVDSGRYAGPFYTAADLAEEFRDGFPGVNTTDIEQRIRRANRTSFDASGTLKDGWRKILIPENTVDLFQAYTHVILDSLKLRVRWIDSWFYHVRFGEIHCGTNVLRRVPAVRTHWWSRITPQASGAAPKDP